MQRRLFLLILLVHDNGTKCRGVEQRFDRDSFVFEAYEVHQVPFGCFELFCRDV